MRKSFKDVTFEPTLQMRRNFRGKKGRWVFQAERRVCAKT